MSTTGVQTATKPTRWSNVVGDNARWVNEHRRLVRLNDALCERYGLGRDGFKDGVCVPIHPANRGGVDVPWDVWLEHMLFAVQDNLICQIYKLSRNVWACGKRVSVEPVERDCKH